MGKCVCQVSVKKSSGASDKSQYILVGAPQAPIPLPLIVDGSFVSEPTVIQGIDGNTDIALYQRVGDMMTLQFNFDYLVPNNSMAEGDILVKFPGLPPPVSPVSMPIAFVGNTLGAVDAFGYMEDDGTGNLQMRVQVKDDTNSGLIFPPIQSTGTTNRLSGFLNYYWR